MEETEATEETRGIREKEEGGGNRKNGDGGKGRNGGKGGYDVPSSEQDDPSCCRFKMGFFGFGFCFF